MKSLISFFSSLKTAIALIVVLTVLAIIGTLVPQRLEAIQYINAFPKLWNTILQLGFDDIYRSPLFIGILFLLSVSAIVCVLIRCKSVHKKLFSKLENVKLENIYEMKVAETIKDTPKEEILKNYKTIEINGTKVAFKNSGKLALIGGLILHIGLVLIFSGGLLGLIFGIEMPISGQEGDKAAIPSIDVIRAAYKADNISRKARHLRQFNPNNPELEKMRTEIEKLHQIYSDGIMHPEFKVSFDKLWIENYLNEKGNNLGVKSWNVELRFMDIASGTLFDVANTTKPTVIKVNEPVSYRCYDFYLSNWIKNWGKIKLSINNQPNVDGWKDYKANQDDFPQTVEIGVNEAFEIKGFPYVLYINSFFPDFRIFEGRIYNASNELKNPAVCIVALDKEKNSEVGRAWAFAEDKSNMSSHVSNLPFKIVFQNVEYGYEATIHMTYDPGKPLVWIGCFLFCLGMMFTFYITYREEWIVIKQNGDTFIALNSNRSPEILKKELPHFEKSIFKPEQEGTK